MLKSGDYTQNRCSGHSECNGDFSPIEPKPNGLILHVMDRQYGLHRYSTRLANDNKEGNSALELYAERDGEDAERVARVVFWDAYGDFFLETFGTDVPVVVAEQLIAEAKASIKIR